MVYSLKCTSFLKPVVQDFKADTDNSKPLAHTFACFFFIATLWLLYTLSQLIYREMFLDLIKILLRG